MRDSREKCEWGFLDPCFALKFGRSREGRSLVDVLECGVMFSRILSTVSAAWIYNADVRSGGTSPPIEFLRFPLMLFNEGSW